VEVSKLGCPVQFSVPSTTQGLLYNSPYGVDNFGEKVNRKNPEGGEG